MADAFHEIRFPLDIALGSSGGPERRTDIVTLASGHERRNARWTHSRRRYDAGYGIKTVNELHAVLGFFEERRGMLTGFRWRDRTDFKSCAPADTPSALDQIIGIGDGVTAAFQLKKRYGAAFAPYDRPILKPVAGTVLLAVNGSAKLLGTHADLDATSGLISFRPSFIPAAGETVSAGFEFDVPVRFDTDRLDIDLSAFTAGAIPKIPLVEILV